MNEEVEYFKLTREEALENMVEVNLVRDDSFRIVRETLERIGISAKKDGVNTLYQTAHILHKQGHYYITHFKLLFAMDGKKINMSDEDFCRQDAIAQMLEEWGLVNVKTNSEELDGAKDCMKNLRILSRADKDNWNIIQKYSIGFRENREQNSNNKEQ